MKQNEKHLDLSESELLEYINQAIDATPIRPAKFGITVMEYCASQKMAFTTGRRMLGKLVSSGKLKAQRMKENGHLVTVYCK